MIQRLKQILDRLPVGTAADRTDLIGASGLLSECSFYAQAVEQLSCNDVEGCTKDIVRALALKAEGNSGHLAKCFKQAVHNYSDALKWLPVTTQPLEAAKIHSNRALSLLQLASTCTCSCCTSKACTSGSNLGRRSNCGSNDACTAIELACAAEQDCTAALGSTICAGSLRGKVLYRRAKAQLLQQQYAAAAADAQAAVTAAQQAGDVPSADDACQLLHSIYAAQAAAGKDAAQQLQQMSLSMGLADASCTPAPQQQQQQQQQLCQQPPAEPDLQQLNLLLQHQAWQAAQLVQQHRQQQQPRQSQQQQQQQPLVIQCNYSAAAGRHVVAAADIAPGSLLMVEQPLAAVPAKQRSSAAGGGAAAGQGAGTGSDGVAAGWCERCFGPLGLAYWTCTHCPMVQYCSLSCRAADSSCPGGHTPGGPECGRPWQRLLPEHARLASRCLAAAAAAAAGCGEQDDRQQQQQGALSEQQVQQLKVELLSSLQQSWWSEDAASFKEPRGNEVKVASGSSSSSSGGGEDSMREQLLEALLLSNLVPDIHQAACAGRQLDSSSVGGSSVNASSSPAAVLTCLGQLVMNGIAIRPLLAGSSSSNSNHSGKQGLGLFPVTALLNHSCDPNCSIRFEGRQLLLVCVRGAAAGAELSISYGPQLGQQPTQLRQQQLLQQYGFVCSCSSCRMGLGLPADLLQQQQQPQQQGVNTSDSRDSRNSACQLTDVQRQEAAAAGLRCSSSSTCRGAVLPGRNLPPGLAAEYPLSPHNFSSSSSSTGGGSWACVQCGWCMSEQMQQQVLLQLQAAAAAADEAAGIMNKHEAAAPAPRQQQQKQEVLRALLLLQRATSMRQQLLHPHNQLLGSSCHQAAAAAVAALSAGVLTSGAPPPAAEPSVALLQSSLEVYSAADVCSLVTALEQRLGDLGRLGLCSCSSCSNGSSRVPAAASSEHSMINNRAALLRTQQQQQQQQQQLCDELPVVLQQCTCRMASAAGSAGHSKQNEQQGLLLAVVQHLQGSVLAAVCNLPADALGAAAEQLVDAAAVAALLDGNCTYLQHDHLMQLDATAERQQSMEAEAAAGQRSGGQGPWCCRCSQLQRLAQDWVAHASHIVKLHMGLVDDSIT